MTTTRDDTAQLLFLASHELRTPVTVVAGYVRMLLQEQAGPVSDRQRRLLEEAAKSCASLTALVTDMSDLARLNAGEMAFSRQRVPLAALVGEAAGRVHEGEDRGIRLEVDEVPTAMVVMGDPLRLRAAIGTLLYATLREHGDAGTVHVRVVQSGPPPAVRIGIGAAAAAAEALAAPADTPFDEWHGGLGFALPIARRILAAHGGRVWALPGAGFRRGVGLSLPLDAPRDDAAPV